MTSNTLSTQCTSSINCDIGELCVLDRNTTSSYECRPKTSVQEDTWIIDDESSPQWYPPENRKTYGQGCQHPPLSENVDGYYGNCQYGLFCDKYSSVCMKQLSAGSSCMSHNQCSSKNCDEVCILFSNKPFVKKPSTIIPFVLVILAAAGAIISYLAIKRIRRERKVQIKLSRDDHDEASTSQRLSSGNTSTFRTTSLVTINGENIISGPYFGDRNFINFNDEASNSPPSYQEGSSDKMLNLLPSRELQERRHTFDALSRPQSILRNSFRNSLLSRNSLTDKRISKSTIHSYYSLNEEIYSESFKDAFDEFPPPAY